MMGSNWILGLIAMILSIVVAIGLGVKLGKNACEDLDLYHQIKNYEKNKSNDEKSITWQIENDK